MRNLVQPLPSELCDGERRCKVGEPDDPVFDMGVQIFVCAKCGHEEGPDAEIGQEALLRAAAPKPKSA